MGLRTKFNLMLLAVALIGAAAFATAVTPVLNQLARQEVLQTCRVMMESASGARQFATSEVAPLVNTHEATVFNPQGVGAYAAKKSFATLQARFGDDYTYREAALNPTNPEDQAAGWEADLIYDFRNHPDEKESVVPRQTPRGPVMELARPLVARQTCLACHETAANAPKAMVAIYGPDHGFGWKPGEVIGAQIVSVPMSVAKARADKVRMSFLLPYAGVFGLLFVLLNLMLDFTVIGPIDAMARTAEAVSLGKMETPEYLRSGSDQIAQLSKSINRLRRSLQEALKLLGDP
jgi:protein-histidine pros-kinase